MVNQSALDIAKTYIGQLPENIQLKKAYLLGSYARGMEGEGSDIDIALVIENMTDFFSTQRLLMRLRRQVDLRIEPHPIEEGDFTQGNPFVREILKHGIELNMAEKAVPQSK